MIKWWARRESCSIMNRNEWWQFFKSHLTHNGNPDNRLHKSVIRTQRRTQTSPDDGDAVSQEICVIPFMISVCRDNETWWIYLYHIFLLCGFFVWYLLLPVAQDTTEIPHAQSSTHRRIIDDSKLLMNLLQAIYLSRFHFLFSLPISCAYLLSMRYEFKESIPFGWPPTKDKSPIEMETKAKSHNTFLFVYSSACVSFFILKFWRGKGNETNANHHSKFKKLIFLSGQAQMEWAAVAATAAAPSLLTVYFTRSPAHRSYDERTL